MIEIDTKKEYDLNNMNVAAQNIQLGSYLKELSGSLTDLDSIIAGSSIIAPHNDLSGLQGGTSGSYYHLTLNNYNKISGSSYSAIFGDSDYTQFSTNGTMTMERKCYGLG